MLLSKQPELRTSAHLEFEMLCGLGTHARPAAARGTSRASTRFRERVVGFLLRTPSLIEVGTSRIGQNSQYGTIQTGGAPWQRRTCIAIEKES
jgi:hypothetical protein